MGFIFHFPHQKKKKWQFDWIFAPYIFNLTKNHLVDAQNIEIGLRVLVIWYTKLTYTHFPSVFDGNKNQNKNKTPNNGLLRMK